MNMNKVQAEVEIQRQILTDYLKVLREEMHLRLSKHYTLVTFKLIGLAAVISFFITNIDKLNQLGELTHYFYLLIPALSIMFDFQIAYNLKWMNTTATFVRDRIEPFFAKHYNIPLYETEALGFSAYLNRLVEVAVTGVLVIIGISNLISSPIGDPLKSILVVALSVFFVLSVAALLTSTKGYGFKKNPNGTKP